MGNDLEVDKVVEGFSMDWSAGNKIGLLGQDVYANLSCTTQLMLIVIISNCW